jgi:hypothetical protein
MTSLTEPRATREPVDEHEPQGQSLLGMVGSETRCRTHDGHILNRIGGTFHDATVNFARCFIRIRGLALQ